MIALPPPTRVGKGAWKVGWFENGQTEKLCLDRCKCWWHETLLKQIMQKVMSNSQKDQAVRNQTQIFSVAVWLLNEQMKQSHWPMTLGQAHVHHSELIWLFLFPCSLSGQFSKPVISTPCYSNYCSMFRATRKPAKFRRTSLQHSWCQRAHKSKDHSPLIVCFWDMKTHPLITGAISAMVRLDVSS